LQEAGFYKAQASIKETMRKMNKKLNEGWVRGCDTPGFAAANTVLLPAASVLENVVLLLASEAVNHMRRNHMLVLVLFALLMFLGMYALSRGARLLSWLL